MRALFKRLVFMACLTLPLSGFAVAADGMVTVKSSHTVSLTANKLVAVVKDKGMTVMDRINHAANAKAAGLEMRPTEVVIFGNPKVGTPLMHCARSVAIDLPQKALIWQDESGQVWLAYNDPMYLKQRHGIEGCDDVLEKIAGALKMFAATATE